MAWTTPMTFVAGVALSASQLNTHLRDNLLQTAPAIATTSGRIFVATGANAIVERAMGVAIVLTQQTTSSTTYVDLTTSGPAVTVTTGTQALVGISVQLFNTTAFGEALMTYAVSGATTDAASDTRAIRHFEPSAPSAYERIGAVTHHTGLTAGSNTFTAKYRVTAGIPGVGTFLNRNLFVIAL